VFSDRTGMDITGYVTISSSVKWENSIFQCMVKNRWGTEKQ
jgi:hypothetical protein